MELLDGFFCNSIFILVFFITNVKLNIIIGQCIVRLQALEARVGVDSYYYRHVWFYPVNERYQSLSECFFLFIINKLSLSEAGKIVSEEQDFLFVSLENISIEKGSGMFQDEDQESSELLCSGDSSKEFTFGSEDIASSTITQPSF